MGKKRKRQADKVADESFAATVRAMLDQTMADPGITRCTLQIDKIAGLARVATSGADGRSATREIIGPGLAMPDIAMPIMEAADNASPTTALARGPAARAARDAQILALAARGLTQTETARVLSISQALVSKVLRTAGSSQ